MISSVLMLITGCFYFEAGEWLAFWSLTVKTLSTGCSCSCSTSKSVSDMTVTKKYYNIKSVEVKNSTRQKNMLHKVTPHPSSRHRSQRQDLYRWAIPTVLGPAYLFIVWAHILLRRSPDRLHHLLWLDRHTLTATISILESSLLWSCNKLEDIQFIDLSQSRSRRSGFL
jgi:hypothetical protein